MKNVGLVVFMCVFVIHIYAEPVASLPSSETILYHSNLLGHKDLDNGYANLNFSLFDSPQKGRQLYKTITKSHVLINESCFTVELDLPDFALEKDCWIEIGIQSEKDSTFKVLPKRQKYTCSNLKKQKVKDQYVSISVVKKVALNQAKRLWGQVSPGEPVPCYDSNDNLVVYMCPFRIGSKSFPLYEKIVEQTVRARQWESQIEKAYAEQNNTSSGDDKLDDDSYRASLKAAKHSKIGIEEYGTIYISARYDSYPIVLCSNYLSPYFTKADIAHKKASKKTGRKSSFLSRYYFLGVRGQAFKINCESQKILLHAYSLDEIDEGVVAPFKYSDSDVSGYKDAWDLLSSDAAPPTSNIHERRIQDWEIMPCVQWCRGCSPTSATMVLGYYDRGGLGAEFLGYGRLLDYWRYFSKYVDGREDVMVNVPNVLNELRQDMETDGDGATWPFNIGSGILKTCNNRNGYAFSSRRIQCNSILNDWCWNNIVEEVNNDRPFVWSSAPTEFLEGGHSLAAFGYKYDEGDSDYKYVMTYNTWDCPGQDDWHYKHYDHGSEQIIAQMDTVVPGGASWGQTSLHVPNGGETWGFGTSQKIWWYEDDERTWSADLEYSTNGGVTWNPIATVQPSSPGWQSYTWTVPNEPAENARVRIKNFSGSAEAQWNLQAADGSENDFTISEPSLSINTPYSYTVWYLGQTEEIRWFNSGVGDFVKLERSDDAGQSWYTITESTYNDGAFQYAVEEPTGSETSIRISSTDLPLINYETRLFEVRKPFIHLEEPLDGTLCYPERSCYIRWTSGGVGSLVDIYLSRDQGDTWEEIAQGIDAQIIDDRGFYRWDVSGPTSNNCRIRVQSAANPAIYSREFFNIYIMPPSLHVLGPTENETLLLGQKYDITWTTGGLVGTILIEKSTDGGATWIEIRQVSIRDGLYEWNVEEPPSENCLIKLTSISHPEVTSTSKPFRIERDSKVLYPLFDEICYLGDMDKIRWIPGGIGQNVQIHIKGKSEIEWQEIVSRTPNDGEYEWEVFGDTGKYQIRITSIDLPNIVAFSPVFSIEEWKLLSPNGGEIWHRGETYNIQWLGKKANRNVKIELTYNEGDTWYNFGTVPCSGQAEIKPYSSSQSDRCRIRIALEESTPLCIDECDSNFEIYDPYLNVKTPIGGNTLFVGENSRITWDSRGVGKTVKIELLRQSQQSGWQEIVSNTLNDGLYNWEVAGPESDLTRVRVSSRELPEHSSTNSGGYFTIKQRPQIKLKYPRKNEKFLAGRTCNIQWSSFEAGQQVKIEISRDGGISWSIIEDETENDGSYLWDVEETFSNTCLIRVSSVEEPLISGSSDHTFSVDSYDKVLFSTGNGFTSGGGGSIVGPNNTIQRFNADQAVQFVPSVSGYGLSSVRLAVSPLISSWNNIIDVSLMDDLEDRPGDVITSTSATVNDDEDWTLVSFNDPIPLQKDRPYWIMCSVAGNGFFSWHFSDPGVRGKMMNRKDFGEWKYWGSSQDHYYNSCFSIAINGQYIPQIPRYPDIIGDKTIDIKDVATLCSAWLQSDCDGMTNQWCNGADINCSGRVDLDDWMSIAKQWLQNIPED